MLDLNNLTKINSITKQPDGNYTITVDGQVSDAIFDKLLETARHFLDAQYKSGNIRKEDYAQASVALYQTTLQIATNLFLQIDLTSAQIEGVLKDNELKDNQILSEQEKTKLYKRQIIGFDDQKTLQATQTLLDTYNVFLSTSQPTDNQPFPNIFVEYFKRNTSNPLSGSPSDVKCMAQLDTMISNLINRANTITDVTKPNGGITIIPDIPQTGSNT